ncbi:MAG: competence/damage-inducible protein A [Candidatus Sericytochromatia bacterium]|nr:competence/damage-inducible protein A [Candidatus Sericytochromatia bacterium]
MRAEILCIGTELIIGQTVNSNATWLSKKLAAGGIDVMRHVAVGDNMGRISDALQLAWDRCDLIVVTGGLGPTDDDLTHAAIAAHFGLPMVEDPEALRSVAEALQRWNRPMNDVSRKMARIPEGSVALVNPAGSAAGIWLERAGHIIVTMPGVPREMEAMWQQCIEPKLHARADSAIVSHLLKFVGIPEQDAAGALKHLLDQANPSVAPYVGNGEVYLRVTAKAPDTATAEALMVPVIDEILATIGKHYFGRDGDTLESLVIEGLTGRRETLAVAESVTGGWLAQRLTAVPGASQVFLLGAVTYTSEMKSRLLGVDPALIDAHGAVSDPVARAMAAGVRATSGATWGIGITGLAGPLGDDRGTPVGRVYIALSGPGVDRCDERDFRTLGRDPIRWMATQVALRRLQQTLAGADPG